MEKRAAIVTLHGLYNYGNRLQNLAVQESLKRRGYAVETLVVKTTYPTETLRDIVLKYGHRLGLRGRVSRKYRAFEEFDRKVVTRRVWGESHLARLGRRFTLVAIGSDQIWNSHRINRHGAEFGAFVPNATKVAVSPSMGTTSIADDRLEDYKAGIGGIDFLSVREFSGQELIHQLTSREALVLIDPTMSMTADEWREHSSSKMVPDAAYALIYLLGSTSAAARQGVLDYVRSKNLAPVVIMDRNDKEHFHAGPQDFLGLIDGASIVITDSFHAVVFSLLFGTDSAVVEREDRPMSTRFDTLVQHFGLVCEEIESDTPIRRIVRDDTNVADRLQVLRAQYDQFLDQAVADVNTVAST